MVSVGQHENIEILSYSEVEEVGGYVGNFTVKVRKKARFVDEELCTGCGLCQEKCPAKKISSEFDVGHVKHCARVAAELGADIVKVNYTGSPETFAEVVAGCPIPVVIAGGEKVDTDEDLLNMVQGAMSAGAAGVSIGRNAFQHDDPAKVVAVIASMVHGGTPKERALENLRQKK